MSSNLLAMPLVGMSVITGTNEDWIDSIEYLVDNGGDISTFPQLDLTGIVFEMEVRRIAPEPEVIIRASTENGTLAVGEAPNYGFLLINVPHLTMEYIRPGNYVGDITGMDQGAIRRCVVFDLEVQYGITRP